MYRAPCLRRQALSEDARRAHADSAPLQDVGPDACYQLALGQDFPARSTNAMRISQGAAADDDSLVIPLKAPFCRIEKKRPNDAIGVGRILSVLALEAFSMHFQFQGRSPGAPVTTTQLFHDVIAAL
jgi:hypothetical protein